MSLLGQSMQYAAGSLDALTPLLVVIVVGILLLAIALLYDAYH